MRKATVRRYVVPTETVRRLPKDPHEGLIWEGHPLLSRHLALLQPQREFPKVPDGHGIATASTRQKLSGHELEVIVVRKGGLPPFESS